MTFAPRKTRSRSRGDRQPRASLLSMSQQMVVYKNSPQNARKIFIIFKNLYKNRDFGVYYCISSIFSAKSSMYSASMRRNTSSSTFCVLNVPIHLSCETCTPNGGKVPVRRQIKALSEIGILSAAKDIGGFYLHCACMVKLHVLFLFMLCFTSLSPLYERSNVKNGASSINSFKKILSPSQRFSPSS